MSKVAGPTRAAIQCHTNPPARILMVEEDPDIRRLNAEVLIDSGYNVDVANDGEVAWQVLQTRNYDLLLMDDRMPSVTGLELIRKLHAEKMALPVVLMSRKMPTEMLNEHPWLQIQAMLFKPYSLAEMLETVKEVLCATSVSARDLPAPPQNWQNLPLADWKKFPAKNPPRQPQDTRLIGEQ